MAKKDTRSKRDTQQKDEFEQRIIDLARVTRVMAGGKRLRFRACMVIGDHNGRIGFGLAKGADVALAISKAVAHARKNIIEVPIVDETIPHRTMIKYKSAQVLFKPAPAGTGIIAGGAVRQVLELAGVTNVVAKILGCNSKINNVKAVFAAFEQMKLVSGLRSKKLDPKKATKQFEPKQNNFGRPPRPDHKKKDANQNKPDKVNAEGKEGALGQEKVEEKPVEKKEEKPAEKVEEKVEEKPAEKVDEKKENNPK